MPTRLLHWLEIHWVVPAYSGWILIGLSLFFFGAATNTMAGWLYVMSGVMLALLAIAAVLPPRSLMGLHLTRQPIRPVSAGDAILIDISLENPTAQARALLQIRDEIAPTLGQPIETAIAALGPRSTHRWIYEIPTQRRGIYRWQTLTLRTAAPLGLFWCARPQTAAAVAIVYPQILSLSCCPFVDELSQDTGLQWRRDRTTQLSTEGLTRALRPYRWGDPTRLVHWRTSARYGELRVRELEKFTAGYAIILGLDTATTWDAEAFEQAVITAASLYLYGHNQDISTSLWTPQTGLIHDRHAVLSSLAGIEVSPHRQTHTLPTAPIIWLSMANSALPHLPTGSRWLRWQVTSPLTTASPVSTYTHLDIVTTQPLLPQLQAEVRQ